MVKMQTNKWIFALLVNLVDIVILVSLIAIIYLYCRKIISINHLMLGIIAFFVYASYCSLRYIRNNALDKDDPSDIVYLIQSIGGIITTLLLVIFFVIFVVLN